MKYVDIIDLETGEVISTSDGKLFFDTRGNIYQLLSECYVQDVKTGEIHMTSGCRADQGKL